MNQRTMRRSLKTVDNSGFGTEQSRRYYDHDSGAPYVTRRGVSVLERISWYHTMIEMPLSKFLLLLFAIYVCINLVFAGLYYLIGIGHLAGIEKGSALHNFVEVFFFSTQTFTTVGYGRISPIGFAASAVATFEAFLGLLSFAIATGLFYGRFSRPQAFLKFSDKALTAPFQTGRALMLRVTPYKNNNLSDAEAKMTLALSTDAKGQGAFQFYNLPLTISSINALSLSWTLVHHITEDSPLYGLAKEDFEKVQMEVMVFVKAFDVVFSNTVVQRTSYRNHEVIFGGKFKPMFHPAQDHSKTVLEVDKLNDYEIVELPTIKIKP